MYAGPSPEKLMKNSIFQQFSKRIPPGIPEQQTYRNFRQKQNRKKPNVMTMYIYVALWLHTMTSLCYYAEDIHIALKEENQRLSLTNKF